MLSKNFFRRDNFRRITAKQIAFENGIEYISNAEGHKLYLKNGKHKKNMFYLKKNRYILLHPPNDMFLTYPFEWYANFYGKPMMVMNNQSAFDCITNLSDILLQMIQLYDEYIDENVFIASAGFAIRLDEKLCPNYHGKATLVMTKDSIRNSKVGYYEVSAAKKFFINDFLDNYIAWNFGATILKNPELENALVDLNNLAINRGLREYSKCEFDLWSSKNIVPYEFKKT